VLPLILGISTSYAGVFSLSLVIFSLEEEISKGIFLLAAVIESTMLPWLTPSNETVGCSDKLNSHSKPSIDKDQ
jgi:hypothetical protein